MSEPKCVYADVNDLEADDAADAAKWREYCALLVRYRGWSGRCVTPALAAELTEDVSQAPLLAGAYREF